MKRREKHIRADALKVSANTGKRKVVLRFVRDYRRVACLLGREQWRLVFAAGGTNKYHSPPKPTRDTLNAICGAAPVQMARWQVQEQIDGWLSNRANEFRDAVQASSLAPDVKHRLHVLNHRGLIYLPGSGDMTLLELKDRKGRLRAPSIDISEATRRLARTIMRGVMKVHRRPNLRHISPRIDERCAVLEPARKKQPHADFWLRLKVPNREEIFLPVQDEEYRKDRGAPLCKATQFVVRGSELSIRVMSDITGALAKERAAYRPERECMAVDFGLTTMFATAEGDLLGRRWLSQLRRYDAKLQSIAKHMQKIKRKPRESRRYRETVADVRGFVRTEINRVLNRLAAMKKPAELLLERIDFRNSELGPRLNRILRNCGRAVIQTKLADLEQRWGITHNEVNPAYSSQECNRCGFVSRGNRPSQSRFACLWCGHKAHADVNGSRTLLSRRPGSDGAIAARDQAGALFELARRFAERMKSQALGRRGDVLRRSAFLRRLKADQIVSLGLTPHLVQCAQKQ
jgi:putative transposase